LCRRSIQGLNGDSGCDRTLRLEAIGNQRA
jgi:hypothetical protein